MSFNRLPYDICSYKHELAESVGTGMYQLGTPPNNCEPCHASDPRIKLQSQGVSISRNTALIDIDSELMGITRNFHLVQIKNMLLLLIILFIVVPKQVMLLEDAKISPNYV